MIIQAWIDGSPDDRICHKTERWHTIAFVQLPKNDLPNSITLCKWSDWARKAGAKDERRGYKKEFMRWLRGALLAKDVSFDAYTFRDSQMMTLAGELARNLRIEKLCTVERDESVRIEFPNKTPVRLDRESFTYIVVLAEVLGTIIIRANKQNEGAGMPVFFLVTLDKVKGDTKEQHTRGQVLKELLGNVGLWQIDLRYHEESDALTGDLLADNISGCLNAAIGEESSIYGSFMAALKVQGIKGFSWNVLDRDRWVDWWEGPFHAYPVSKRTLKRLGIA